MKLRMKNTFWKCISIGISNGRKRAKYKYSIKLKRNITFKN
jgi:hypothetical protein